MSIPPNSSDSLSVSYHEKMSWTITEDDISREECQLKRPIPGAFISRMYTRGEGEEGGFVDIATDEIVFVTFWPLEVDLDKIHVNAEYKVKTIDGELVVAVTGGHQREIEKPPFGTCNSLRLKRRVTINTDLLFDLDEEKSFILEAELVVEMRAENLGSLNADIYVEEMKSIFLDKETSDVLVIAEGKQFKCHKNIFSARSEVFKNTLGHDTLESNRNEIVIKEITAEAVEGMLKYLYTGEIPNDPKNLTTELLQIADMHQLHPLMEACLKNLVRCLDVPSCISTFILVDRYQTQNGSFREIVIEFMKCKAVEVVKEKDCDKLIDSHPALAKELMRALACARKEKNRCKYCVVSYN